MNSEYHKDDNQVYERRLGHLESEVGDLKASQARVEARVETGFSAVLREIKEVSARQNIPKAPINLIGWIGTALTVLTIIAGFAYVVIQPIIDRQADVSNYIQKTQEAAVESSYRSGKMDQLNEANLKATVYILDKVTRLEGRVGKLAAGAARADGERTKD